MEKVIVTNDEFKKGYEIFMRRSHDYDFISSKPDEDSLVKSIIEHQAKYVIVGVQPYNGRLYDILEEFAVIARFGVGYENINLSLATSRGIFCTNTPGVLTDSVAELTASFLLEISRKSGSISKRTKAGDWSVSYGSELRNKRLAIIGCGKIGMRVARIMSLGFGMRLIGYDEQAQNMKKEPYIEIFSDLDRVFLRRIL